MISLSQKRFFFASRFLEFVPGVFSWSLILFPLWGAYLFPVGVAYYVIGFDVYWLYRSISTAFWAVLAHFRILATQSLDWMGEVMLFPDWRGVRHLAILPLYKEPL